MANRKTFEVKQLLEFVNDRLANSYCTDSERLAMASVLERVLHDTGNYAGYGFLSLLDSPDFNESRRFYYTHRDL